MKSFTIVIFRRIRISRLINFKLRVIDSKGTSLFIALKNELFEQKL